MATYYKFLKVTSEDIKDRFREHTCESDIEYAYKYSFYSLEEHIEKKDKRVRVLKATVPNSHGCATDGLLIYNHPKLGEIYIIQEVKRKQAKTVKNWKKQFLQTLMYKWMFEKEERFYDFAAYILDTENIFVYILRDDAKFLYKKLWPIFAKARELKYSPSTVWKYSDAMDALNVPLNFVIKELDSNFLLGTEIDKMIKHGTKI